MSDLTITKGRLFVEQVLARIKGDDQEALAKKMARKVINALEGQVAALKTKVVDDEIAIENAEEDYRDIKYPTTLDALKDPSEYCKKLVKAQEAIDEAKEALESTKKSIAFFEKELETFG